MELWTMPDWMEKYRDDISNTGGNKVEDLMNDNHTSAAINYIRAALIMCVISQVSLLQTLHKKGLL